MIWVDYLVIVVAVFLIISVMLQKSDDNIQDAFSGAKSELQKNRKAMGFEAFLTKSTAVLTVSFVALIIVAVIVRNIG